MTGRLPALLALAAACAAEPGKPADAEPEDTGSPAATIPEAEGGWRSALYPADWTPAYTAPDGGFLHDFSYAGYHRSEVPLAAAWPGAVVDVTDFGASVDADDNTAAFQAAIDALPDGGAVEIPAGTWRLAGTLTVTASGVLIRGAGIDATRLHFAGATGDTAAIAFRGAPVDTPAVPLATDGAPRSHTVTLADASGFAPGDHVLLDWEITAAFVADHGMAGIWDTGSNGALGQRKVFFRREITAVDGDTVTLDVPLRYPALVRDGAALRQDVGALAECGVEGLSLATAIDEADALAHPRRHALGMYGVRDCFVRNVGTFAPDGHEDHLRSGGVEIVGSKRVTVATSSMAHAQHKGDGGAGYAFEVSASSDVLFADDEARDVRHGFIQNWDFGASGLVFVRCSAEDDVAVNPGFTVPGRSELHHRLAIATLFDATRDTAGFAAYNRGEESSNAGHAGTETVFWNVAGAGPESRLSSYQVGRGYVIGTTDLTALVVPDLVDAVLGAAEGTDPVDWLEGVDAGATLEPASLFEDQLARRLGR